MNSTCDQSDKETLFLLHRVYRALFLHHNEEGSRDFQDLSLLQVDALRAVKMHGPLEMGDLAKQMGISPASASTMADRLVKAGCLERIQDETDRRIVKLMLSPAARTKFESMLAHKTAKLSKALEALSVEERRNFITSLTAIEKHIH